jgi:hypothetical protein
VVSYIIMNNIPGIINVVTDLNLPSDGVTDCYPILQSSLNSAQSGSLFLFPQMGIYSLSQPLIVDKLASFESPSLGLVTIKSSAGRINPLFNFGLRQNESGNIITSANRPDCYGVLDRSFVSASGLLSGYRTLGTSFVLANAHPIQIGQRSQASGDHSWDYWSECSGITIEFVFQPYQFLTPDTCLFEWGSHQFHPAPIAISVSPDGSNRFAVAFKTADMNSFWDTSFAIFYGGNTNTTKLTRVQIWIDVTSNSVGIIQDGSQQSIQWITAKPNLTNNHFQRNRGQYPFFIAAGLGVQSSNGFAIPDIAVYGLRMSNIVRQTDPGSDGKRYLNDANTIAYLPGSGPPLRSLDLAAGSAADAWVGSAWIVPKQIAGGLACGGLKNLIIKGGSPCVVNTSTLGLTIDNCIINGYHQAIGNLPAVASYPVNIKNCPSLSGGDTAVSLWKSSVYMNNNVIERGGITSIRTIGCNLNSKNDRIAFTSGGAETAVEILPQEYGGAVTIEDIDIDSESATPFSDAVFRCETSPYTTQQLLIYRPRVSGVGPDAIYVDLVGHPVTPGVYNEAKLILDCPTDYTNNYKAAVNAGVGWFGKADTSQLSVKTIIGPNASQIETSQTTANQ